MKSILKNKRGNIVIDDFSYWIIAFLVVGIIIFALFYFDLPALIDNWLPSFQNSEQDEYYDLTQLPEEEMANYICSSGYQVAKIFTVERDFLFSGVTLNSEINFCSDELCDNVEGKKLLVGESGDDLNIYVDLKINAKIGQIIDGKVEIDEGVMFGDGELYEKTKAYLPSKEYLLNLNNAYLSGMRICRDEKVKIDDCVLDGFWAKNKIRLNSGDEVSEKDDIYIGLKISDLSNCVDKQVVIQENNEDKEVVKVATQISKEWEKAGNGFYFKEYDFENELWFKGGEYYFYIGDTKGYKFFEGYEIIINRVEFTKDKNQEVLQSILDLKVDGDEISKLIFDWYVSENRDLESKIINTIEDFFKNNFNSYECYLIEFRKVPIESSYEPFIRLGKIYGGITDYTWGQKEVREKTAIMELSNNNLNIETKFYSGRC